MTLQPGQTIGRYQILEPLGVGGMATVYKAYQPSLEREVALKVLRPGFAEDPEFFQRFQREARSIAKLRHPHIVQIFDFEPLEGRYVLAMEFLEGGTLKERAGALALEGKRMPAAQVSRIIGEVADALTYAHELGIVHRDVKPANVMLAGRDRAVVTDFGIAKIVGGEGQTQTGVGIGTPEYMAPEQGTGTAVDHRADIYSLGVMAYELITGRVPFIADTPIAVVLAHIRDPLPLPSSIDPSVDAQTERVLLKALAKNPDDRYASATDFADALRAALLPPQPTAATVYPITAVAAGAGSAVPGAVPAAVGGPLTRIPRNALIGTALLALLLVGGAAFAFTRGGGAPTTSASTAPTAKGTIALRGPLIYEAKLDAAGSEIQFQGPPGPRPTSPPGMRTLDGAVELTAIDDRTPVVFQWRRRFPVTLFAEMDVKVTPGSDFNLGWELWRTAQAQSPQARIFLTARPRDESASLDYALNQPGQFNQPELIGSAVRLPGFGSGTKVTIGIAVQPQGGFTMFLDGKVVGQGSDSRAAAIGGEHLLSVDVHGASGTMTLTGFRVYELASPTGTTVAGPQGGQGPGQQPGQCGQPPLPPCPAAPVGGASPPGGGGGSVPKGPLLFQARFDGSAGDVVIEKSGTASTQAGNGELRVTVGGGGTDAVKVSLPQRPGPDAYTVEYDLLPSPNAVVGLEFVIRATQTQVYQLAIDAGLQARLTEMLGDGRIQLRAGPVPVVPSSSGQFTVSIRGVTVGRDTTADVWVNGVALFPQRTQSGLVTTPTEPLSMRVFGQSAPGGSVTIKSIRLYQPAP